MFLIEGDYFDTITEADLDIITSNNAAIRIQTELQAEEMAKSYLRGRYDITKDIKAMNVFSMAATYAVNDWVYLDGVAFGNLENYSEGDIVVYEGNVYTASTTVIGVSNPAGFNSMQWDLLGVQYAKFTAIAAGTGNLVSDTDFFLAGDPRNQALVFQIKQMVLFMMHTRLNPRSIPELRKELYDGNSPAQVGGAIGFLKMIQKGELELDLTAKPDTEVSTGRKAYFNPKTTYDY